MKPSARMPDLRSGALRSPAVPLLLLLLLGACVVAGLILAAALGQDRIMAEKSVRLVGSLMAAERRALGRVDRDYAWWDEAVAHLAVELDEAWAEENIGPYLNEAFGIRIVLVLDPSNRVVIAYDAGKRVVFDPERRIQGGLPRLIDAARVPDSEPRTATGLLSIDGLAHVVAVTAITRSSPEPGVEAAIRSVLVFTEALDDAFLARSAADYDLRSLALIGTGQTADRTSLGLSAEDGSPLGALVWTPETPGNAMFRQLLPPVAVAFGAMALLAFVILRRIDRTRREIRRNVEVIAAKNDELEALAALQATTWNAIDEGIGVFDRNLRLVSWNRTFERMYGFPTELLLRGAPLLELLRHCADRGDFAPTPPDEAVAARLASAVRRDAAPVEHQRADGQIIEVRQNPMPDGGFVSASRNVTERKRFERELLAARDSAQLANRSKSEFLANVSHELRTPLNAVLGFSEVLKDELFGPIGSPTYREYARDIHSSGALLLELINDILDLAKIEAGKVELNEEPVEVLDLCRTVLRVVGERARQAGLSIAVEVADRLPPIRADKRALKQILLNLLSNAVKFTPSGGRITLAAGFAGDGGIQLSVHDTGIGIAAHEIPKVMQVFGQVDSSLARKHGGVGLGLPLSRALTELHRGSLDLTSEPGVGTTVVVRLPPDRIAA